jgi:hypothetical protein
MIMKPSSQPLQGPYISTRQPLSRRTFLRGAGVAMALPFLDTMLPTFARGATSSSPLAPNAKPRRFFAINNNLGFAMGATAQRFFPDVAGRNYPLSPYLKVVEEYRNDFTVFSGVSYPNVDGGHPADICFVTGAPHPGSGSFRNTISVDQLIAERIGTLTRFPSLTLAVNTNNRSLSCTGTGVAIPPETSAAAVFKQLFVQGSEAEVAATITRLENGRSVLDAVAAQAKGLQRDLPVRDRERLDQYFTSVRDLESRLKESEGWERKPKPVVNVAPIVDPTSAANFFGKVKAMYDLAKIAFETDSTRAITLMLNSSSTPIVEGITDASITEDYHNLSHHGKSEEKLAQLRALDVQHMKMLGHLYGGLKSVKEDQESLLDRTMVYFGSNFGDANQHVCFNMPVLLAGGGFKHGQHLAFDREPTLNYPLTNVLLSMIHRMGIEVDKFSSSTGTMRGLEMT